MKHMSVSYIGKLFRKCCLSVKNSLLLDINKQFKPNINDHNNLNKNNIWFDVSVLVQKHSCITTLAALNSYDLSNTTLKNQSWIKHGKYFKHRREMIYQIILRYFLWCYNQNTPKNFLLQFLQAKHTYMVGAEKRNYIYCDQIKCVYLLFDIIFLQQWFKYWW